MNEKQQHLEDIRRGVISITKQFGPYPFAHRQPDHDGHCATIHGHSWHINITFTTTDPDNCGFVMDFGKMKAVKELFGYYFDHTIVLDKEDPILFKLNDVLLAFGINNVRICKYGASCEAICAWVNEIVRPVLPDRVNIKSITVFENERSCATLTPE